MGECSLCRHLVAETGDASQPRASFATGFQSCCGCTCGISLETKRSSPLIPQTPILQFHSGYQTSDLAPVIRKLHAALSAPPDDKLKAIRNKYSHK